MFVVYVVPVNDISNSDGEVISLMLCNFFFYAPKIEERGAYCFWPVCHSVILSETLTMLITFGQWVLEFWYFIWVFLVIRPSVSTIIFYPVTLTLEFDPFILKTFNLANKFWTMSAKALLFHLSFSSVNTFP